MRRAPLLSVGFVAACSHTLRIPTPTPGGPGAPLPAAPVARIEAPLQASFAATLARLDARVPRTFDTGGQYQMLGPSPVGVRYEVTREPFRFTASGGALHAETTLALRAEACVGAPLGLPIPLLGNTCQSVASCGVNEAPRRVVIRAETVVGLDPSWRIVARTTPAAPEFLDRCTLTMFQVDVTGLVASAVEQQVADATREMDALIARNGDLRPRAEAMWQGLQRPVDLGEGFWLSLRPQALYASPFAVDPSTVRTTVGIVARPTVTAGTPAPEALTPLPPVTEASAQGEGFRVTFDATVNFAEATELVRREFRGRTLELHGDRVFVRDMRVAPHGGALLFSVDARFDSGPFSGQEATVYLAGLPDWEERRRAIVVRELDYSLETRSALLSVGESLVRGSLRDELAEKAVFPLGERIDRVRASAERALTRELAPGTALRGRLTDVRPAGAYVTDTGVVLRVEVVGRADVSQDMSSLHLAD